MLKRHRLGEAAGREIVAKAGAADLQLARDIGSTCACHASRRIGGGLDGFDIADRVPCKTEECVRVADLTAVGTGGCGGAIEPSRERSAVVRDEHGKRLDA